MLQYANRIPQDEAPH